MKKIESIKIHRQKCCDPLSSVDSESRKDGGAFFWSYQARRSPSGARKSLSLEGGENGQQPIRHFLILSGMQIIP